MQQLLPHVALPGLGRKVSCMVFLGQPFPFLAITGFVPLVALAWAVLQEAGGFARVSYKV